MDTIERNLWQFIDGNMGSVWHCQRHEDKHSVGIPDVSYGATGINGWIELKASKEWPTAGLPKFTRKQINWLQERQRHGGNCYIVFNVINDRTILVFSADVADKLHKDYGLGKDGLLELAIKVFHGKFDSNEFLRVITNGARQS